MKLYTAQYNNYFNRNVYYNALLSEYQPYVISGHVTNNIVNFNYGDGITTTQVVNYDPISDDYAFLVEDNSIYVSSRWFIINTTYIRKNQYQITLKRDVIADNLQEIDQGEWPIFVQKGHLNANDDMICNDEGMSFNKIKVKEQILSPKLADWKTFDEPAWIVGYVTKDELKVGTDVVSNIDIVSKEDNTTIRLADIAADIGITEGQLVSLVNLNDQTTNPGYTIGTDVEINYGCRFLDSLPAFNMFSKFKVYINNNFEYDSMDPEAANLWSDPVLSRAKYNAESGREEVRKTTKYAFSVVSDNQDLIQSGVISHTYLTNAQWNKLLTYNHSLVYYNNAYYTIDFDNTITLPQIENSVHSSNTFVTNILNRYHSYDSEYIIEEGNMYIYIHNPIQFYMNLKSAPAAPGTYRIPISSATSRRDCAGSVCDIFAIPFGTRMHVIKKSSGAIWFDTEANRNILLQMASTIATQLGKQCYDIQVLPYCPIPICSTTLPGYKVEGIDIERLTRSEDYDFIYYSSDGTNWITDSVIFWLSTKDYTFNLPVDLTVTDRKIESQTDTLRICSPTGQGYFDMNVAKNNGLSNIKVNVTYKPYNPYIQLLPAFGGLYGSNYNDYRGIVCAGDYSLTRIEDAWITYQLNNKNYQNMFSRDIQSLDVQQSLERAEQPWKVAAGTVTGAASGAVAGGMIGSLGGPVGTGVGAVVGAAAGAVSSGVAGYFDAVNADKMRAEQREYAIDKYRYQLGNIQALPDTITKVDNFMINSKIYPFLEFYTCTEAEKTALVNKIKYDGMSVQRIGTLNEFSSGDYTKSNKEKYFFKGQLIKQPLDEIVGAYGGMNTQVLNTIYDELLKGVYL